MALKSRSSILASAVSFAAILAFGSGVFAAPLPQLPPLDLCGAIVFIDWLEPAVEPAQPGYSGSIAVERHWPGRAVVILDLVCTDDAATLETANMFQYGSAGGAERHLEPGQALLVLPHDAPPALSLGRTLCVQGFAVSGDEGGTWTRFESLMQLPAALGEASLRRCVR